MASDLKLGMGDRECGIDEANPAHETRGPGESDYPGPQEVVSATAYCRR